MNRPLSYLSEALRACFGTPLALKTAADCSWAAASRYFNGHTIPNVPTLARLIGQSPELLAAFIEYAGLDERSLQIAAVKLRHAQAALQTDWTAAHADMERHLAAREARLRVAEGRTPAVPDGPPPSGDQQ